MVKAPLRIGAISYPFLFQTIGGLQIQVWETVAAVQRLGHDMRLIDVNHDNFTDFDLVHVFAAIHGNDMVAQQARDLGVPVVMSPLVRRHWTRALGRSARWIESIVGRLTRWEVTTNYRQIHRGLHLSQQLIALGPQERDDLVGAFEVPPERVTVVPNGIPARYFDASPAPACERFGLEPGFILCVASIEPHKNQLGLARAAQGLGREIVLVGQCMPSNQAYLEEVLKLPNTRHVGSMTYDDPALPSIYAAAGVTALVSQHEVMPLVTLEALAAGSPAIVTRNHSMGVRFPADVLHEVDPNDTAQIRQALAELTQRRPAVDACKDAVRRFSWDAVAKDLVSVYEDVISRERR
jgi:glycosyltransferase involved in cell wall biosynthesis